MANLPGLSYNPYTGLTQKKTTSTPPYVATGYSYANTPGYVPGPSGGLGGGASPIAAAAPDAGTNAGPGYQPIAFQMPDFSSLINNDPAYNQSLADLGASHASNLASLTSGLKQAAIAYGAVPGQDQLNSLGLPAGALSGLMSDETRNLAQQNTAAKTSTVARLGQAYTQGRSQLLRQLAARGALQSGEAGYQLGNLQTQKTQADYDAVQRLLGLFGNEFGQYSGSENTLTAAERQAAQDAADRAQQQAMAQAQAVASQNNMQALFYALSNWNRQQLGGGGGGGGGNESSSPAPAPPPSAYHGQTYNVGNPGFTSADVAAYRYSNPFNPNR